MSRRPEKPWKWKGRRNYYVILDGQRHNLGPDREEAYRRFHELQANGKSKPKPGANSVVAVIDEFLDACKTDENLAPSTYEWYRQRLQLFVETIPRDLPLRDLEPKHVTRWIKKKEYRKLSSGTRRNYCRAIQRAMNWAAEQDYVNDSPLRYFKKPPGFQETTRRKSGGCHQCFAARTDSWAFEGPRIPRPLGDGLGNRSQAAGDLCRLSSTRRCRRGCWVFPASESKGKKRIRVLYLTDTALAITKRLMLKYPEGKLFRNTRGNAWTPDVANCRFRTVAKKVGKKYCLYDYRHTWATRALENGVDSLTVSLLLGHADTTMLSRHYAHLSQKREYLRKAAKRASA